MPTDSFDDDDYNDDDNHNESDNDDDHHEKENMVKRFDSFNETVKQERSRFSDNRRSSVTALQRREYYCSLNLQHQQQHEHEQQCNVVSDSHDRAYDGIINALSSRLALFHIERSHVGSSAEFEKVQLSYHKTSIFVELLLPVTSQGAVCDHACVSRTDPGARQGSEPARGAGSSQGRPSDWRLGAELRCLHKRLVGNDPAWKKNSAMKSDVMKKEANIAATVHTRQLLLQCGKPNTVMIYAVLPFR